MEYRTLAEVMNRVESRSRKHVRDNEEELREKYGDRKIAVYNGKIIGVAKDDSGFTTEELSSFQGPNTKRIHIMRPVLTGTIDEIVDPPLYIFDLAS